MYLCAVKYFSICGTPTLDPLLHHNGSLFLKLQYTLKGIKKSQGSSRVQPVRLPVTVSVLKSMLHVLHKGIFGVYIDTMLKCAFIMAFFAFLRCGEFTAPSTSFNPQVGLTRQDVQVEISDAGPTVFIHLKASKTDPFRLGITVRLCTTNNDLCPVSAYKAYAALRDQLSASAQTPFFMLPGGQPLTRQQFTGYLDNILTILHLPSTSIRPHSFRIGAATAAASAGVPSHLIKTLGRWSSDCYQRYIRTSANLIAQAQLQMSTI